MFQLVGHHPEGKSCTSELNLRLDLFDERGLKRLGRSVDIRNQDFGLA
jgi:hypothetical protein